MFDPAELREMLRIEQATLGRWRERYGSDEEVRVQPPSGGGKSDFVRVKTKRDGGEEGGPARQATWTYSIFRPGANLEQDDPLATGLTPEVPRRTEFGEYKSAPDGSAGSAYQEGEIWHLHTALEVPAVETCTLGGG